MKVLIIEPHGDDAYISAYSILSNPEITKHVLTVGSSRDSTDITSLFKDTTTEYLDLPEIDYSLRPRLNTHDIHRRYLNNEDVYSYFHDQLSQIEGFSDTVESLVTILSNYADSYDMYYIPVGLEHPYHAAVSLAAQKVFTDVVYYCEKPYVSKRFNKEILSSCLANKGLVESVVDYTLEDIEYKSSNFLRIYPTEGSLLVWTKTSVLEDPDIFIMKGK